MKFIATLAALSAAVVSTVAQSPAGFMPMANATLRVTYNSTSVMPGMRFPPSSVASQPLVAYTAANATAANSTNATAANLYQLYMIDLSLPLTSIGANATASSVAMGLNGRGTRLHWWQTNLTMSANGSLAPAAGSSIGPAPYQGPAPPATDSLPHNYAFFLFRQPANYSVPAVYTSVATNNTLRANFSLTSTVAAAGQPIAGNYFLASQNYTMVMNATTAANATSA